VKNTNEQMNEPANEPAHQRGLKRSLDQTEAPDEVQHNYTVFTYAPGHCDEIRLGEERTELSNAVCSGCQATFAQKSILEYQADDANTFETYADFQFHQYGQLCLLCRAPFPGEGHFEERLKNPLGVYMSEFIGPEELHAIVWDYYKQELPAYPRLSGKHYDMLDSAELPVLFCEGLSYMGIAGVEHVYWRTDRFDESTFHADNDAWCLPDIKLDYRYWRPRKCECVRTPCECICFPAQVRDIKEKLKIPNTHEYKILGKLTYTDDEFADDDEFGTKKYLSLFVYLRESAVQTDIDFEDGTFEDAVDEVNAGGVCQAKYFEEQNDVITLHTLECQRRNAKYSTYECMLNENLCGRCADCLTPRY
jgi:hypothetical protein